MKVTTMTTTTKTMSSPGGADKYYPPPLMRFLRSNVGSKSRGRTASSKSSPLMFINRRRSSGTNSSGLSSMEAQQEPSSPTVTCIGQIRVKRGSRSGPSRRRRCHQCTWVPSATSACRYEKMRPCCCVVVRRPSWPKWSPFSSCTNKRRSQQEEEEDDEEEEEEEEEKISSRTLQQVVEAKGECCFEDDEEEEEEEDEEVEKRVSVYESVSPPKNALLLPPKNALLLTRCRSAPYWSSSLTYRFGGSPLDDNKEVISKFEEQEEELEEEDEEEEEEGTTTTTCPTSKRASLSKVDEEEPLMIAVKELQRPVAAVEEEALRPVILTRCRSEPARTGAEKLDRRKEAELAEMWQVLMAAAVAGSTTLVSKRFLARGPAQPEQDEIGPQCTPPPQLRPESPDCGGGDVIFRFSSSGLSSSRRKKKMKMMKNKRKGKGKEMSAGRGPRVTGRLVEYGGGAESASGGGRKFVVRLKRRRISKIMLSKSSSTKDNSLFSWGLGVGMVCMMSAGKTEIGKLSAAMDETSKVVNELRAELSKRKVAQVMTNRGIADFKAARLPDVECPSSVLMEEPEVEVLEMEMDLSEAELESELKSLPWFGDEAPKNDSVQKIAVQTEASTNKFDELEESGVAYQCHGLLGQEELDKRLSHMLIEHQENQIVELESELHLAQSKLHEKEAELQALKQLTQQFSISSVSDDEDDDHERELQDFCSGWNNTCENGSDSRRPVVGMKRPILSPVEY